MRRLPVILRVPGVVPGDPARLMSDDVLAAAAGVSQQFAGQAVAVIAGAAVRRRLRGAEADARRIAVNRRILLVADVGAERKAVGAFLPVDAFHCPKSAVDVVA